MGTIDVMFVAKAYGSFQCEEAELNDRLAELRQETEGEIEEASFPYTVGEAEVEVVSIADVDPETGDLTQRMVSEMEINPN